VAGVLTAVGDDQEQADRSQDAGQADPVREEEIDRSIKEGGSTCRAADDAGCVEAAGATRIFR
jgi:hypothetical protein